MAFQRKISSGWHPSPLPCFIEPALASSIENVPTGERWLHEINFEGYRI
jgi:bifunctional non-homologous end joining protein LigD